MNPTVEQASTLSYSACEVFNLLCFLERKGMLAFPSQEYIAKKIGITRVHCNRIIKELAQKGFIEKFTRRWHSCIYRIHPSFWLPIIRERYYPFFRSLQWICIAVLMSPFPGYVTHILKRREELRKNSFSYIRLSKKGRTILEQNQFIHSMTESPWPSHLSEIKSLNLTKWGQIALSIYPQAAIEYADSRGQHVKSAADPFKYFTSLCKQYCFDKSIEVKFETYYMLQGRFGALKQGAPMILDNKPIIPVAEKEDYYKKADAYQAKRFVPQVTKSKYLNNRGISTPVDVMQLARDTIAARQANYSPNVLARAQAMRSRLGIREDGVFQDPSVSREEMIKRFFAIWKG